MKLETMLCIKDGLADATNGINAKIAALTLNGSDTRPANPTRGFDTEDAWVANRQWNADDPGVTLPALAVFQAAPIRVIDVEPETIVRDVELQLVYAYLVNKQDADEVMRDGHYFIRALLRWHTWFMRNDQAGSFRTRNGIIIRTTQDLSPDDAREDFGAAVSIASVTATYIVRETQIT